MARDITLEDTFYHKFTSRTTTGVPTVLAGTPVLSVYEDNNVTQITAGVSLGVDHDGVVGLNLITVVATAANGYEAGKSYDVIITTGTVGGVSVVGEVVHSFTVAASAAAVDLANATDGLGVIVGRLPAALVSGKMDSDATAISGDTVAADNLELQYDTTGLAGDTFPATQSQLSGIANVGAAVNRAAASYVLTTGTQSSGTIASVAALDGTNHEHTDVAGALDLYYEFNIGAGLPTSVTVTGYLNGNNDNLEVYGFDWVASAWVAIGTLAGKNAATNEVNTYNLFVDMVGSAANEGIVRVRFTDGAFTLTSATLAIDQIFTSFAQGSEGYENAAVWLDTGVSNTNTVVDIDGTARNPVSTIAAANTLLASTNLHTVSYAPGASITFAASQTAERHEGRDWTLALGGQDITSSFISGAVVSGVATATAKYEFDNCCLNGVTLENDGDFNRCSLADTLVIGQAGIYTFHQCFTRSGATITIDFGILGATTIHMFAFDGEINFTNMAAGDSVHITGSGTITTTTSTGGTINHNGFFEYTDAGGNITEIQSDIKVAVDATLTDTAELQADWTNGGRLDLILDDVLVDTTEIGVAGIGLTAVKLGVGGLDAAAGATDFYQETADQLLNRNMATGTDSGSSTVRTLRDAARAIRNRVVSDSTQIYVYEEDDTTIKWTASINTVPSTTAHISGADPNS